VEFWNTAILIGALLLVVSIVASDISSRLEVPPSTERTTIAQEMPARRAELATGWNHIARRYFKHQPPAPSEIEAAIEAVEDEIMRVRHEVPGGRYLHTADAAAAGIAIAAGAAPGEEMILSLEAVEQAFQRLATGARDMPHDPRFTPPPTQTSAPMSTGLPDSRFLRSSASSGCVAV
jgi:hypothetical protein